MTLRIPLPQHLLQLVPYQPGPPIEKPGIIRLGSNENSFGASPLAIDAIEREMRAVHRYPEDGAIELRGAIARKVRVQTDQIILGNGSTELVQFCANLLLQPDDNAVTANNTFVMYRIATILAGGMCKEARLSNYKYDPELLRESIDDHTKLVLIANPNNPTGTMIDDTDLESFLKTVPPDVLIVLDEAYFEFVERSDYPNGVKYLSEYSNLLVLRTFSKIYGLAGLRIGYGIGHPELIANLNRIRAPFNTSNVAQAAALAALNDEDHVRVSRESTIEERNFLEQELSEAKIPYVSSVANFVFLPAKDAAGLQQRLLDKGVFVRAVKNGLRVTVGRREENLEFLGALNEVYF
jgi:histidinol-phosphate aminotransferase